MNANESREWKAPIFVLADDDRGAVDRVLERLHPEWFYIPVTNPRLVLKYAKRMETTAVFLADPIEFPRGGAAALLQQLIDEVGKPVVILVEHWTAEIAERWKRMGAEDCLPHPTRFGERLELFRCKMQHFALTRASAPIREDCTQ